MFGKISQSKGRFSVDLIVSALIRNIDEIFDYPGDMHDFWEMVYVMDGNATITEDENVYLMTAGNVIFHRPMEFHKLYIQSHQNSPTRIMIISFKCVGDAVDSLGDGILNEHIYENLSVDDIASIGCMSRSNVQKLFKTYSGCGVMQQFNRIKVAKAMDLIKAGMNINEISVRLAYTSPNYFSEVFKREVGVLPSRFKQQVQSFIKQSDIPKTTGQSKPINQKEGCR